MRITMESQPALIGLKTNNAKLNMHTELPKMELETTNANQNMRSTLPKIQIDQRQCFSESGLKGILELSADNARNAVQEMYASIGRIVEQGNELTNFHNGGNAIADQGEYNAYDQFDNEFGMVTMPQSRPQITVSEGRIDIDYQKAEVKATPRLSQPEMTYVPGSSERSMRQYNSLKIDVVPSQLDLKG